MLICSGHRNVEVGKRNVAGWHGWVAMLSPFAREWDVRDAMAPGRTNGVREDPFPVLACCPAHACIARACTLAPMGWSLERRVQETLIGCE